MYQFPMVEIDSSDSSLINFQWKDQTRESAEIIHKLSHQTLHAIFHHIELPPLKTNENWIKIKNEDIQDYPLPRIIDRYLEENS